MLPSTTRQHRAGARQKHRTCIICNPHAGAGKTSAIEELIGGAGTIHFTEGPGHASALAQRAAGSGFDTVVAAGGDGTLHEVVNGLCAAAVSGRQATLGLLPLGTGNDFARTLAIPTDIDEALHVLEQRVVREIDLNEVEIGGECSYCINVAVGGVVDQVRSRLTDDVKSLWGPLAYLRATAETLPELQPYEVRIELDDEVLDLAVHNVVVANGRTAAGGVPVAPEAMLDDGLLDCVIVLAVEGLDILTLGSKVLLGNHLDGDERIVFRHAREVRVHSLPEMAFNLDGEQHEAAPVSFRVLPRALRMIVGEDAESLHWESTDAVRS